MRYRKSILLVVLLLVPLVIATAGGKKEEPARGGEGGPGDERPGAESSEESAGEGGPAEGEVLRKTRPAEAAPAGGSRESRRGEGPYSLSALIDTALEDNRELLGLRTRTSMSRSEVRKAKAARFPTLDFRTNLSYIANPPSMELKPGDLGSMETPSGEIKFPEEKTTVNLGSEDTNYEFSFILDQPIFTWGKISNSIKLSEDAVGARQYAEARKKSELKTRISVYYYTLYFLDKIETLISKQQQTGDRLVAISEKSYENGFIVYTDLLETRIRVKEIDLSCAELQERRSRILLDLRQATGMSSLSFEDIDFSGITEDTSRTTLASQEKLVAQALEENPDLQLLKKQREIASHKLEIARSKQYLKPDLGLHLEFSLSGPNFPLVEPDWYGQDEFNFTATAGITTTIFDGGRIKTDITLGEQQLREALYGYQQGRESIETHLRKTLRKIDLNREKINYYQLKCSTDEEQVELKKTQYESGAGSEREYLQALITLYADRAVVLREKIEFFNNFFTIKNITNDF